VDEHKGGRVSGSEYTLSNEWPEEGGRLAGAEALFDPVTFRHLDAIGVASGWSCLELGGGSGSVALWMAERVGPGGSVVVTDLDTRFLDQIDLPTVEVRAHDIRHDPLDRSFDLIHARLLLEHLPERIDVLAKLRDALAPDGWLCIEDADLTAALHLPADRQFVVPQKLRSSWRRVSRASMAHAVPAGYDGEFARELPRYLADAGLVDVDAECCSRLLVGGSLRAEFQQLSLRQLGAAYATTGVVTQPEIEALIAALSDPETMAMSVPVVSAWGRRPS
jgi:SAM-dependent methyltransferase